ncbi:proton channel OTOP1 [Gastrophryne carolinensis]
MGKENKLEIMPGLDQTQKSEGKKLHLNLIHNYPQKNAEILSSQYGFNIFLVGLIFMFAWAIHAVGITDGDLLSYLITLMLIQLVWMLWYIFGSYTQRRTITEKDTEAGARWLRCGITLFAVITLILDTFKIGNYIGYSECLSITEGIFPVAHTLHTLLQVYFLWFHAKDVIQSFKTLERFGLIHAVFTNLLLWANGVLTESKHQLNEHKERLITLGFSNITMDHHTPECNCTSNVCSIFSQGIYYLYPFTIEYHILASTMLYVLWKNIGRHVKHHQQQKIHFKFHGITLGTILGMIVLTTTIAVLVVYLILIGCSKSKSELALTVFYLFAIIVLTLMCTAGVIGLIIYRLENKSLDDTESPAKKLDSDLLVGSACGSWLISWGSILAIICAETRPDYSWYNLPYSILVIIEKYIQNLFIIECIHRKEEELTDDRTVERIFSLSTSTLSLAPSYEVFNESATFCTKQFPYMSNSEISLAETSAEDKRNQENNNSIRLPPSVFAIQAARSEKLNKKRRILKNIAAFLFLCNISLWIPPAFGCRPQYDNGLEEVVFGFEPWLTVVNLAMPFSIFYRMHSASSLFEVYWSEPAISLRGKEEIEEQQQIEEQIRCSVNLAWTIMDADMIHVSQPEPVHRAMKYSSHEIMDIGQAPLQTEHSGQDAHDKLQNSETASSQYGVNIFIVGLFLMLAIYLKVLGLTDSNRLIFLIILMLIQIVWMIFYISVGERKRWASTEKDGHAGARWLRCGIVLFAVTTLLMHALKLGYFVGYSECMSITEGIYPVTHMVHTFFQVYFLWRHSKDVIKSFKALERFGLIHSVFTNLLLWASAVATESDHQLEEHLGRLMSLGFLNISLHEHHLECNCSINLCNDFKSGIYYIYPFYIEYQILASAMFYVLWKNVGNNLRHLHHNSKLKLDGIIPGTLLGFTIFAATLAVVATYLMNIGHSKSNSEFSLSVFYFYSITVLMIMSIALLVGMAIYNKEENCLVKEKSPAVKLDAGLLLGSATGFWIISWGSILAIIFAEHHPEYTWYNLPYSVMVIVEVYIQNIFIITYLNHNKEHNMDVAHIEIPVAKGFLTVPVECTEFKTLKENTGNHVQDGTLRHVQDDTLHHIQDGTQHHVQDCTLHHIQDGTLHHVQDGTLHHIQDGTLHHVQDGTLHHIQDGTQHHVQDCTLHHIQDGTLHHVQDGTLHHVQDGTLHHVQDGTLHHVPNGTQHQVQDGFLPHVPEGSQNHVQDTLNHVQGSALHHIQKDAIHHEHHKKLPVKPRSDRPTPKAYNFKKLVLKNITVVLFLCNISLWIPPAFGCRPQYDNGLEAIVYGLTPWIIIIDVSLPFSIFYRMHSAYSLFDVFCKI